METLLTQFKSFLDDQPTGSSGRGSLSKVSIKNYVSDLRRFLEWFVVSFPTLNSAVPQRLDQEHIDAYIAYLQAQNTPTSTLSRHLSSLRRFITFIEIVYQQPPLVIPSLNLTPSSTITREPSDEALLTNFRHFLKSQNFSDSTVKNYVSDLKHFLNWNANGPKLEFPSLFNPHAYNTYSNYLKINNTVSTTISRRLSTLKTFSNFAQTQGLIDQEPTIEEAQHLRPPVDHEQVKLHGAYLFLTNRFPLPLALGTIILLVGFFAFKLLSSPFSPLSSSQKELLSFIKSKQLEVTPSGNIRVPSDSLSLILPFLPESQTMGGQVQGVNTQGGSDVHFGGALDENFNLAVLGYVEGNQLRAVTTTAPPLVVQSSLLVTNLNSDLLDGFHADTQAGENEIPAIDNTGAITFTAANPRITSNASLGLITNTGSDGSINLSTDGSGSVNILTNNASGNSLLVNDAALTSGNLIRGQVGNGSTGYNFLSFAGGAGLTTRFSVNASGSIFFAGTLSDSFATDIPLADAANTTLPAGTVSILDALNNAAGGFWTDGGTYLYPTARESVRVYDSGGTDYIDLAHNGTDAVISTANTGDIRLEDNVLITGTLAVNGDTITADGDLTINSAGDNIISPDSLNFGGGAASAFNFFALDVSGASTPDNTADLYVQDELEVDGTIRFGNITYTWPTTQTASYFLQTDGSGTLSWAASTGTIDGSGTTGFLARWTDSDTLGNSVVFDTGTNVGIGDTSPASLFTVGSGDLFQINSSGEIVSIDGVAHSLTDSSGDLLIDSAGGNILSSDVLNIGGAAAAAYNYFATTIAGVSTPDGVADLYIQDELEVDGTVRFNNITYTFPTTQSTNYILSTDGSGTLSWVDPNTAGAASVYWTQALGLLYPKNATVDVAIGGSATTSAKFAFINVNSGDPTATISGNLALAVPTGSGPATKLNIFNGGTFGIRTSVGGDAGLSERLTVLNNGNVGIGSTAPSELFSVGSGNLFTVSSAGSITTITGVAHTINSTSGNLTLTSNSSQITVQDNLFLTAQNDLRLGDSDSSNYTGFQSPATLAADVLYTLPSADATTANQILSSNGSGTLAWIDVTAGSGGGGANLWTLTGSIIHPTTYASYDLAIGSNAEASAPFFVNHTTGTISILDTAGTAKHTISNSSNNLLLTTSSNGTKVIIQPDLQINGGDILNSAAETSISLVPSGGDPRRTHITGEFTVDTAAGIGTTDPAATLDVRGSAIFNEDGGDFDFRIEGDNDPNLFTLDGGTDTIAIGSTVETNSKLFVSESFSNVADNIALSVRADQTTAGAATLRGARILSFLGVASGTQTGVNGLDVSVGSSGATGGTISLVQGISATAQINSGVTATDMRLFRAAAPSNSGTITTLYGLYLDAMTAGGTNYAIYSAGGQSYHEGNLGIGTSTISAKVHSLATTEQLRLAYDASNYASFTVASDGELVLQTTGTDEDIEIRTGTFDNAIFIDDSASQVGINTNAPGARLDVRSTSGKVVSFWPTATTGDEWWIDATNPDQLKKGDNLILSADPENNDASTEMNFHVDNVERFSLTTVDAIINETGVDIDFRVESDGDANALVVNGGLNSVGIGTLTPAAKLEVEVGSTAALTGILIDQDDLDQVSLQIVQAADATANAIDINTLQISGNIIDVAYAAAETLSTDVAGILLNLNTNVTMASDFSVTGIEMQTPGITATGTTITDIFGYNLITAAALDTANNADVTTINWYGTRIQKPNIDTGNAADTTNSWGLYILGGTVTDGAGTENNYGVVVDSNAGNSGFGTAVPTNKVHIFGSGSLLRLDADTATGDPTMVFSQTATNRSFIEFLDASDDMRLRNLYGEITFNTGTGGSSALAFSVETDGDIDAEGSIELDVPAAAAGYTFAICHNTDGAQDDVQFLDCNGSAADIAEYYITEGTDVGDIVVYSDTFDSEGNMIAKKSAESYQKLPLGVVSTYPTGPNGDVLGSDLIGKLPGAQPIGLIGRVPVKISLENGPIKAGDPLTLSSTPGVAMKATKSGNIVGFALENYDGSIQKSAGTLRQEELRRDTLPNMPAPKPLPTGVGKILVFTDPGYHSTIALDQNGEVSSLSLAPSSDTSVFIPELPEVKLKDSGGNIITKSIALSQALIANLKVGSLKATNIYTDGLTIMGQSLTEFVDTRISLALAGMIPAQNDTLESPLVDNLAIRSLETDLISPQSSTDLLISLSDTNPASETGTLIIDGNASISGELIADSGKFNTLEAEELKGKAIDDLRSSLDSLRSNIATDSSALTGSNLALTNLSAEYAAFSQFLTTDLYVENNLITSNISSAGCLPEQENKPCSDTLYLQPNGTGSINLLAGLLTLTDQGEITVNGNLTVTGRLFANDLSSNIATVSSLLHLGTPSTTDSGGFGKLLAIYDEAGQQVASVDTTGSAQFKDLRTSQIIIAAANESTASATTGTATSNATIGTSAIPAGTTEVVINNALITDTTLIYLTPISNTNNQVLFVKAKAAGTSFTIAINNEAPEPISFNYWLIQTQ